MCHLVQVVRDSRHCQIMQVTLTLDVEAGPLGQGPTDCDCARHPGSPDPLAGFSLESFRCSTHSGGIGFAPIWVTRPKRSINRFYNMTFAVADCTVGNPGYHVEQVGTDSAGISGVASSETPYADSIRFSMVALRLMCSPSPSTPPKFC